MPEQKIEEYMTFNLGNTEYAIELPKIREILTYPELITPLPNTEKYVKGLVNLRGEVVPVLDLRVKFGIEAIFNENTAVIAILTNDKRMLGIVVDKVDDVDKLDSNNLSPASDMSSSIPLKYIKGYSVQEGNNMLVVMDIEATISREELS
jgi:purine-binding chemotaxis protein CheW